MTTTDALLQRLRDALERVAHNPRCYAPAMFAAAQERGYEGGVDPGNSEDLRDAQVFMETVGDHIADDQASLELLVETAESFTAERRKGRR